MTLNEFKEEIDKLVERGYGNYETSVFDRDYGECEIDISIYNKSKKILL